RTLTGLLPQDPESCASTNSAIRAVSQPWRGASGAEGSRTPDLLNAIQALSQLSYSPVHGGRSEAVGITGDRPRPRGRIWCPARHDPNCQSARCSAGLTGLEPATSAVTVRHSNQTELQPLPANGRGSVFHIRAGDRTRTGDLLHGKQTLYQLSY